MVPKLTTFFFYFYVSDHSNKYHLFQIDQIDESGAKILRKLQQLKKHLTEWFVLLYQRLIVENVFLKLILMFIY